jgi:hypothetical protein
MVNMKHSKLSVALCILVVWLTLPIAMGRGVVNIGGESALDRHLRDGDEFTVPITELVNYGRRVFAAHFTIQDGAGRPLASSSAFLALTRLRSAGVIPKSLQVLPEQAFVVALREPAP